MKRVNVILSFVNHYKYLIVFVGGFLIVGVLDENSFMKRVQLEWQISDLKEDINKYKSLNEINTKKLRELKRDPSAIKKIARENYFMKADDEDIFVLSDDPKTEQPQSTNETTQ
ncbi:FtsB family cell division protein [Hoylesella buccalis]|nr:septum formation initiator family protein [Hoylesella buccalis]